MYTKIIAGHDLHEGGRDAVALGQLLAGATGAKLVVAGAEADAFPSNSPAGSLHDLAEETGADLVIVGSSNVATVARVRDADEIVIGSRGFGRLRSALGSVSQELLHLADRPVVVIPHDAAPAES